MNFGIRKEAGDTRAAHRLGRGISVAVTAMLASGVPGLAQSPPPATASAPAPLYSAGPSAASDDTAGALPDMAGEPSADAAIAPAEEDQGRTNTREGNVDGTRASGSADRGPPGIRFGTLLLRPALSERIATESTKTGKDTDRRTYSETELKGTLTTDWSRHELSITGQGAWQKNISGTAETEPTADIAADLRLDLADETVAHLTAGYNFGRESTSDPNAIEEAAVQSGIHQYSTGASLQHDFGRLRGTVAGDLTRWNYSDARLGDGTRISLTDRNRTAYGLRARLGYEMSPALIPFLEVSAGHVGYDETIDRYGYARSGENYGAKAGLSVDFGEKLRGEIGFGYKTQTYEDDRLEDLSAATVDGNITWSPQRDTDLALGFTTGLEPSTTPGLSGTVAYGLTANLTRQLRENLVATLSNSATWRKYPDGETGSDNVVYETRAGLQVDINRYFALTADVGYELTDNKNSDDTRELRAAIGITARR